MCQGGGVGPLAFTRKERMAGRNSEREKGVWFFRGTWTKRLNQSKKNWGKKGTAGEGKFAGNAHGMSGFWGTDPIMGWGSDKKITGSRLQTRRGQEKRKKEEGFTPKGEGNGSPDATVKHFQGPEQILGHGFHSEE